MSIKFSQERCTGCQLCTNICPGNLIEGDKNKENNIKNKPFITDKENCWDCGACLKKCPFDAIEMYLLEDLGSEDITLRAVDKEDEILWSIRKDNQIIEKIKVSKKESNVF